MPVKLGYWLAVAQCNIEECLMWLEEHVLRRCAVCRRRNGTGHKFDCHREYTKERNR